MKSTTYATGATNKILTLEAWNLSDGSPYTGGAYNTATIAATYTRDGGTPTTITLQTMTAGTWVTSGFVHRGKGVYELGVPNLALQSGADGVEFAIDGISGVVFDKARIELTGVDPRSAAAPDVNLKTWLGATPNALASGKVDSALVIRGCTAQAGAAGSVTLDAGASAVDNFYRGLKATIVSGTGAGQVRLMAGYTGSTKVATVTPNWITTPDATSVLVIGAWAGVDVEQVGLTQQTARDLGASVLISSGTGAGQLDVTSGVIKANLFQILGAALTETAGQLAAGFKKFFNVTTPTLTTAGVDQTGDNFARLGAPAGASIAADLAAVFARLGAPAGASIAADLAANLTAVNNISNLSSYANIFGPTVMEIPDSGSVAVPFTVVFKDADGHLVDVDTNAVTLAITNAAGTSRAGNLSAVTHPSTGVYLFSYTVSAGDAKEGLRLVATAAVSSAARRADFGVIVEDYDTVSTLAAIKAQTDKLTFSVAGQVDSNVIDWKGAAAPAMTGDAFARLGAPVGASISADIAEVAGDTDSTLTKIGSPAGASLAADVAAVNLKTANLPADPTSETNAATRLTSVLGRIGTPAGASLAADVAEVAADTDTTLTKLGSPALASLSADIAAIKLKTDLIDADAYATHFSYNAGTNTFTFTRPDGSTFTRVATRSALDAVVALA